MTEPNEYKPDFVTHPGETFLDMLIFMAIERQGYYPRYNYDEIIAFIRKERYYLRAETLAKMTNVPKSFWENRLKRYEESIK